MIRIFFLSQSSPILELFPFDKITLKSYICTVVTVMAKQCWSQTVLESGSWGHSVLQTPALVFLSQSSPFLELFPFDKIPLKSYICTVVTVMAKQCWRQTVLESGSLGHSVLQTPALVSIKIHYKP